MIPGLDLVPLNESEICCGAAGSYNLTQPAMAERLGLRKAKNLAETGADAIFSGNVGCLLQIGRYLRTQNPNLWIAHPVDALWASYTASRGAIDLRMLQSQTDLRSLTLTARLGTFCIIDIRDIAFLPFHVRGGVPEFTKCFAADTLDGTMG